MQAFSGSVTLGQSESRFKSSVHTNLTPPVRSGSDFFTNVRKIGVAMMMSLAAFGANPDVAHSAESAPAKVVPKDVELTSEQVIAYAANKTPPTDLKEGEFRVIGSITRIFGDNLDKEKMVTYEFNLCHTKTNGEVKPVVLLSRGVNDTAYGVAVWNHVDPMNPTNYKNLIVGQVRLTDELSSATGNIFKAGVRLRDTKYNTRFDRHPDVTKFLGEIGEVLKGAFVITGKKVASVARK
jgi:hypothetical protein